MSSLVPVRPSRQSFPWAPAVGNVGQLIRRQDSGNIEAPATAESLDFLTCRPMRGDFRGGDQGNCRCDVGCAVAGANAQRVGVRERVLRTFQDRKSTRLNSSN